MIVRITAAIIGLFVICAIIYLSSGKFGADHATNVSKLSLTESSDEQELRKVNSRLAPVIGETYRFANNELDYRFVYQQRKFKYTDSEYVRTYSILSKKDSYKYLIIQCTIGCLPREIHNEIIYREEKYKVIGMELKIPPNIRFEPSLIADNVFLDKVNGILLIPYSDLSLSRFVVENFFIVIDINGKFLKIKSYFYFETNRDNFNIFCQAADGLRIYPNEVVKVPLEQIYHTRKSQIFDSCQKIGDDDDYFAVTGNYYIWNGREFDWRHDDEVKPMNKPTLSINLLK